MASRSSQLHVPDMKGHYQDRDKESSSGMWLKILPQSIKMWRERGKPGRYVTGRGLGLNPHIKRKWQILYEFENIFWHNLKNSIIIKNVWLSSIRQTFLMSDYCLYIEVILIYIYIFIFLYFYSFIVSPLVLLFVNFPVVIFLYCLYLLVYFLIITWLFILGPNLIFIWILLNLFNIII